MAVDFHLETLTVTGSHLHEWRHYDLPSRLAITTFSDSSHSRSRYRHVVDPQLRVVGRDEVAGTRVQLRDSEPQK